MKHSKNITVMSRTAAIESSDSLNEPTIIISINEPGCTTEFACNNNIVDVLRLFFSDEEAGQPNCITVKDGKDIINFIDAHKDIDNVIVHCSAGVSRSAGVAAALMLIYNGSDKEIFSSPKYCPNMTCYRTVLLESSLYKEDDIETMSKNNDEMNTKIWYEARKDD